MEKQNTEKAPEHPEPVIICPVEPKEKHGGTCCYCIPLKPACFIIGYLSLFNNLFNTLSIAWSLAILGIESNGFRYYNEILEDGTIVPDIDGVDQATLHNMAYVRTYELMLNFAWLLANILLIVGLHKRRPALIKVHVAIATVRFIVIVFIIAVNDWGYTLDKILAVCVELGIVGYLILMFYTYAKKLDTEIAEEKIKPEKIAEIPEISITEHFAYPKYLEVQHLVDKERF